MQLENSVLYNALPALAILFVAELVFLIKEHRHDNKDMFTSFALAAGTIPISLITTGIVLFIYSFIYQFRFFSIPSNQLWVWLVLFFADDFSYYWFHRMSHQIRFLWASHVVHHTSENFNLASGIRVPWTSNLTGTFLFWAWIPLIGIEPAMIITMKSISVIYQFWVHTEAINKLPKWFESVFVTPSHHRVHHSSDIEYLDKNHGGTLIIWDKIFGTFHPEVFKPKYGLTQKIKSYNPCIIALHEWNNLINDVKKTTGIKHKVGYFLNPPGWSHDGSKRTTRELQSGLSKL